MLSGVDVRLPTVGNQIRRLFVFCTNGESLCARGGPCGYFLRTSLIDDLKPADFATFNGVGGSANPAAAYRISYAGGVCI